MCPSLTGCKRGQLRASCCGPVRPNEATDRTTSTPSQAVLRFDWEATHRTASLLDRTLSGLVGTKRVNRVEAGLYDHARSRWHWERSLRQVAARQYIDMIPCPHGGHGVEFPRSRNPSVPGIGIGRKDAGEWLPIAPFHPTSIPFVTSPETPRRFNDRCQDEHQTVGKL